MPLEAENRKLPARGGMKSSETLKTSQRSGKAWGIFLIKLYHYHEFIKYKAIDYYTVRLLTFLFKSLTDPLEN